jgi:hypothetical protein
LVRLGLVWEGKARLGLVWIGKVRPGEVWSGQIRLSWIRYVCDKKVFKPKH